MDIKALPAVTYTLEGFLPTRGDWVAIQSGLKDEIEIAELLNQLKIDPKCPRSLATAFRIVKVTREVIQFMEIGK